jgi:hypothetical protein
VPHAMAPANLIRMLISFLLCFAVSV